MKKYQKGLGLFFLAGLCIMCLKVKYFYNYKRHSVGEVNMEKNVEVVANEIIVQAEIADVADWFLLKENMSNKKIQKLCYYAQAWSLAKLDTNISKDCIFEAWVHGPVNTQLYKQFKGFGWQQLKINEECMDDVLERTNSIFCDEQKNVLEAVWDTYGHLSADELESLTHREIPWLEQRNGFSQFENCSNEISPITMKNYYRSIAIE